MIANFSRQLANQPVTAAIEWAGAVLDAQCAEPEELLNNLFPHVSLVDQLTFDHVGLMLPYANGQQAVAALDSSGFKVTQQFESMVVARLLRERCGQSDLRISITLAERMDNPKARLELFCPENLSGDHYPGLDQLAVEIAHIAYRPVAGADFDKLCDKLKQHGLNRFMDGSNTPQQHVGGSGVCLRYFVKPDSVLGQIKLELVAPMN